MKQFFLLMLAVSVLFVGSPSFATAKPKGSAPTKVNNQYPFINGHFALTGVMKTNGYRSNAPTVVVVDKGSHSTHILQLQKLGRHDEIVLCPMPSVP